MSLIRKMTQRAIFSEPRTWDQAVTVQAGETAHVNSIISQKQAYLLKNDWAWKKECAPGTWNRRSSCSRLTVSGS